MSLIGALPQTPARELFEKSSLATLKNFRKWTANTCRAESVDKVKINKAVSKLAKKPSPEGKVWV